MPAMNVKNYNSVSLVKEMIIFENGLEKYQILLFCSATVLQWTMPFVNCM